MNVTEDQEVLSAEHPSITWLNMTGDVTLTWDDESRDAVLELVKKKMAQGYAFFVIHPRALKVLGDKKVALTKESQLKKATAVVIPDSQAQSLLKEVAQASNQTGARAKVDDADIETVLQRGHLRLVKPAGGKATQSVRRATSANDVLSYQTVAIRPLVGG